MYIAHCAIIYIYARTRGTHVLLVNVLVRHTAQLPARESQVCYGAFVVVVFYSTRTVDRGGAEVGIEHDDRKSTDEEGPHYDAFDEYGPPDMGGYTPAGSMGGHTPAGGMEEHTPAGGMGGHTPAGGMGGHTPVGGMGGHTPVGGMGGHIRAGS